MSKAWHNRENDAPFRVVVKQRIHRIFDIATAARGDDSHTIAHKQEVIVKILERQCYYHANSLETFMDEAYLPILLHQIAAQKCKRRISKLPKYKKISLLLEQKKKTIALTTKKSPANMTSLITLDSHLIHDAYSMKPYFLPVEMPVNAFQYAPNMHHHHLVLDNQVLDLLGAEPFHFQGATANTLTGTQSSQFLAEASCQSDPQTHASPSIKRAKYSMTA